MAVVDVLKGRRSSCKPNGMLACSRCKYCWMPRNGKVPKSCPKCRSTKWMESFYRLKCNKCGHEWGSSQMSKRCPGCGTFLWNRVTAHCRCANCGREWTANMNGVQSPRCPQCLSVNGDVRECDAPAAPYKAEIIAMYGDGMTCAAISIKLGASYANVISCVIAEFGGDNLRV